MKKRWILLIVLIMSLAFCECLTACGNNRDEVDAVDKVYELTLSVHDPKTSSSVVYIQSWADKVAEATDGKVKITIYDNAVLSALGDIADNVKAGAVDIGWMYTPYFTGQFPLSEVISLPMQGFGDPLVSTNILWSLTEEYDEIKDEWSDYKLLMLYGNPGQLLCASDSPITTKADLAGRVMRCPGGGPITDFLIQCGASPVTMDPASLYEAVEKKNINGYIFEPIGICNFSLEEVTNYYTDYTLYDGPFALIMNIDKWNSLPEEYQRIIEDLSGKDASIGAAEVYVKDIIEKREKIEAAGGKFVELEPSAITEMQDIADGIAQDWVAQMSADGFDAAAYLDDAKMLAEKYRK